MLSQTLRGPVQRSPSVRLPPNVHFMTRLLGLGRVEPHATAGGASRQVLQGAVHVHANGQTVEARSGDLVVLGDDSHEPLLTEWSDGPTRVWTHS